MGADAAIDGKMIDAPPGIPTLSIMFTASTAGGVYNPKNIDAVWIQGPGAATTFIKTIGRWSGVRTVHLVAWNAAAGAGDVDAVSGATQATYAPLSLTWDLKNKQGTVIPDGMYTVRMESTDLNATTAAQNHQGTFTFVKGATAQNQTGLSNGGFTNVSINFKP
jgi:hypothetical protein